MSTKNLLVELFVEELPPKALKKLGEAFAGALFDQLKSYGLPTSDSKSTAFASPRRLAAHISCVLHRGPDQQKTKKLMPRSVAFDAAGAPTPALLKRAQAEGCLELLVRWPDSSDERGRLFLQGDGKDEALFFEKLQVGTDIETALAFALDEALKKLPIPKVMTYQLADGWSTVNFVRPAHGLVALHGADVINIGVLGLTADRTTQGHRFEAKMATVSIKNADSYEAQMESEGAVIPSFAKRRAEIVRQIAAAAAEVGGGVQAIEDDALLDEVTALVERPNVLLGRFDEAFLEVPQECLILTMKANQKYFPLLNASGKLTNQFLIVSNISPTDTSAVIGGNERVIRPRLADAKFFFDQDRKKPLASRVEKLGRVVYHNKLGTQLERMQRVQKLANEIALLLKADAAQASRAAYLAKADLTTDMVGEFPELQGIMGEYYARHDGEPDAVARAIEAHYHPRFAGDTLPADNIGAAVAMADKLETVVGIYGIGLGPTGDKDPFGLRRHALGILRMLVEMQLPLDLMVLLQIARAPFGEQVADSVVVDVQGFMFDRLKGYLRDKGFEPNEIEAVLSQNPTRIDLVLPRLQAVVAFKKLPEAEALAAANKRIQNILKKAEPSTAGADLALFSEDAERSLFDVVTRLTPKVQSQVANEDYADALCELATARAAVDRFFDEVMVMAEEPLVRANRLALLKSLGDLMNQVADISKLAA